MLFDGILLKCCDNIRNTRSTSAIFHLLSGKKSIQTVQDAHIYDLKNFYGIYKPITKQIFDDKMNSLIVEDYLTRDYILTTYGTRWLHNNEPFLTFNKFNGIKYHTIASVFSERLLLFIQTLANGKQRHFSFIPVIDRTSVFHWMKYYYEKIKSKEAIYLTAIYDELHQLLNHFPNHEACMFVERLSGYKIYGKSSYQLSERYNLSLSDVHLMWTRMIHQILSNVHSNAMSFPVLNSIVRDIENQIFITNSANKTFQLLQNNYSPQEIALTRKLKINTIYDHIVEIALFDPSFPISSYVTTEQHKEIVSAIKRTNSSTLKQIKENVNDEISYFQIRLVFATVNTSIKI